MSAHEEVVRRLERQLTTAYRQVAERASAEAVSLRHAAYEIAIERVVRAAVERGVQ